MAAREPREREGCGKSGIAGLTLASWPGGAPFALFLSHDIDEIYDREWFRILGDLNHFRRVWLSKAPGQLGPCWRRITRAILRPREPGTDVEKILSVERECGFRSTFFLLEDDVFARRGGRYRYADVATRRVAKSIEKAGCEIAMHGAYHNGDDGAAYRRQAHSFSRAFGRIPTGVRNHYLHLGGVETWRAQREAGFRYDATFGFADRVGVRDGRTHPFLPLAEAGEALSEFVVLPMTVMDCTLFWTMSLNSAQALVTSQRLAGDLIAAEGLFCLNWHNNYFDEEEYAQWQEVYGTLLGWLESLEPWCATGAEIADWWVARRGAHLDVENASPGELVAVLTTTARIEGLTVRTEEGLSGDVDVEGGGEHVVRRAGGALAISFRVLEAGRGAKIRLRRGA